VARAPLLVKSHFALEEIAAAARAGVQAGKAVDIGNLIADREWWQRLRQQAERAIDLFHEGHPERAGMGLNDLRSALKEWLRLPGVFEGLVQELCNAGFRQAGTAIMRASHRPALSPHLRQAGERLRNMLSAKPFDPPSRKELAPDSVGQQALRFLIETFEVVDVSPDLVMSREAYAAAVEKVQECLRRKGSATVSDLRQALGTSRRIMVPLVERLDREGVTRRQGDVRVLAQPGG
jgi:selenocysteine-specific elongation factor